MAPLLKLYAAAAQSAAWTSVMVSAFQLAMMHRLQRVERLAELRQAAGGATEEKKIPTMTSTAAVGYDAKDAEAAADDIVALDVVRWLRDVTANASHVERGALLLYRPASVVPDKHGFRFLHCIALGADNKHVLMQWALEEWRVVMGPGRRLDDYVRTTGSGQPLLHVLPRGSLPCVPRARLLRDCGLGVSVDTQDYAGNTALHVSNMLSSRRLSSYLLQCNINYKLENCKGQRALLRAPSHAMSSYYDMMKRNHLYRLQYNKSGAAFAARMAVACPVASHKLFDATVLDIIVSFVTMHILETTPAWQAFY
jgi:hypothetical protein